MALVVAAEVVQLEIETVHVNSASYGPVQDKVEQAAEDDDSKK